MLGFPPEQGVRPGNVELIVVIRKVDHPWPYERLLLQDLVFDPRSRFCQRLRDFLRFPVLAVQQSSDCALDFVVAQRLRLSDKQWQVRRQLLPLPDEPHKRFPRIGEVHKRLSALDVAGVEMAEELPFINARDLLR